MVVRRVMLALAMLSGCRGVHESLVKAELVQRRFFERDVRRSLSEVDQVLLSRMRPAGRSWCELCTVSVDSTPDGGRKYCLSSHEELMCLVAKPVGPGATRFVELHDRAVSANVIENLWAILEPEAARQAEAIGEEELSALASDEEESFVPRWSFAVGAKAGAVVSSERPTFTFGGQVGFRWWASLFLIPGAVVEVESANQGLRTFPVVGVLARVEVSLWRAANLRFWNLPNVSFVMGSGPVAGFGNSPGLGGRAIVGIHMLHQSRYLIPLFFEVGYQVLEVDRQSSSGFRVALGVGL
jgi:hypothetical protein